MMTGGTMYHGYVAIFKGFVLIEVYLFSLMLMLKLVTQCTLPTLDLASINC